MFPQLTSQEMLNNGLLLLIIILCLREFVVSLFIIIKGKKYKLLLLLILWPIVLIIKAISITEYERILRNYFERIRFFAYSSLIGSVLFISSFTLALIRNLRA